MPPRIRLPVVLIAVAAGGAALAAFPRQLPRPLPDRDTFLAEARKRIRSDNFAQGGYIYTERETRRERDSDDNVTRTTVRLTEVYPSSDPKLTYRRRLSVDGVPTANLPDRDRRYREKVREWIDEQTRKGLTATEAARLRREAEDRKERAILDELPLIFDFRILGRETIDGRPTIVLAMEPKPGSKPRSREAGIARHFSGKVWIDEQDYELVRAHAESVDSVTYGWGIIARLSPGAVAHFERRKHNGEAWLPTYAHFSGSGRVMLLKRVQMDQTVEYFDYRQVKGDGITTFPLQEGR